MVDKEMKERVKRYRRLMKSAHTLETEREMMDLDFTFTCMDLAGADQQYLLPWQKHTINIALFMIIGTISALTTMLYVHLFPADNSIAVIGTVFGISLMVFGTMLVGLNALFNWEGAIGKAVGRYRAKRINAWLNSERWE